MRRDSVISKSLYQLSYLHRFAPIKSFLRFLLSAMNNFIISFVENFLQETLPFTLVQFEKASFQVSDFKKKFDF